MCFVYNWFICVTIDLITQFAPPNSFLNLRLPWWLRRERICLQCRRSEFDPWVGQSPWSREWLPILVFLPGESHGQRNLVGYCPWSCKASDMSFHNLNLNNYSIGSTWGWDRRRKWQPTPVFLPREFHGQRSLVDCHLWGHTESDTTEAT